MANLSRTDEQLLHDWLSDELNKEGLENITELNKHDPEFEAELSKFQFIRKALRGLPSLETPRSFRLTSDMAGVKPPKPGFSYLINAATALFSLVFVVSFGIRINSMPFGLWGDQEQILMVAEDGLAAPEQSPEMAPLAAERSAEPTSLPETLTFSSAPAEGFDESTGAILTEPLLDTAMKMAPQEETQPAIAPPMEEPVNFAPGIRPLDWLVWVSLLVVILLLAFAGWLRERYDEAWRAKWKNER